MFDEVRGAVETLKAVARGPTELTNLWRICTHHHALKTHGHWRVVGNNGDRDMVPPDDPDPP